MNKINDSGRFVFNKKPTLVYNDRREQTTPSKPDNIRNEDSIKESFVPNSLYTYTIGVNEIEANNNTYEDTNIYVSKPIKINENVLEVSLEALEKHPAFDEISNKTSKRQTSVEYYVSIKEKPSTEDWLPILPSNIDKVKSERLMFNGINAKTLFPYKMHTVLIYRDGVLLDKNNYHVLNNQEIQIENYQEEFIYTVDYEPNLYIKDAKTINIDDFEYNLERITEEFPEGTDSNKTITLKHIPYINKIEIVKTKNYNPNTSDYRPIDVSLINASIRNGKGSTVNYVPSEEREEGDVFTKNKTLYMDDSWSNMKNYNLEEGYYGLDYYQYKNKITFADHINIPMIEENEKETPGTGTIVVSYDALVTHFRLKIILRRNTQNEVNATPIVKEYKLRFKSVR